MNFRRKLSAQAEDDIDLTSLIDVMFILLIFFLVTASFAQSHDQNVPVELPQGSAAGHIEAQEELTVYIQADGTVALSMDDNSLQRDIGPDDLVKELTAIHQKIGERPLFLRGDENVRYGEVVRVLDASRKAGFTRVFNVVRGQNTP